MTRFILVRHGQTAWNEPERFRGREDLPLNELGCRQAEAVAQRIAQDWPDVVAVYTSPLQRTTQTAAAIACALDLTSQPLEALLDLDYGAWQGLSHQEAAERHPELYNAWHQVPQTVQFPNGESLADVRGRVWPAVQVLARQHAGQTVVLVGHQVVNRVLLCAVLGMHTGNFWQLEQATGCLNVFEDRDGLFVLVQLNDTCHLRELDSSSQQ